MLLDKLDKAHNTGFTIFTKKGCTIIRDIIQTSGGLSKDFAGSGQNRVTAKTKFEVSQVTLFPSLTNNIYSVICIGLIQSCLRL